MNQPPNRLSAPCLRSRLARNVGTDQAPTGAEAAHLRVTVARTGEIRELSTGADHTRSLGLDGPFWGP